jgi:hypothetical protein
VFSHFRAFVILFPGPSLRGSRRFEWFVVQDFFNGLLVLEWASQHRSELFDNWNRARDGVPMIPIDPLD